MGFTSDTQIYQHVGLAGDPAALAEVAIGKTIGGGAVDETLLALQNAHSLYTTGNRLSSSLARWPYDGGAQQVLWTYNNTLGVGASAWFEVAAWVWPRALDRDGISLIFDHEDTNIRGRVYRADTGATVGGFSTTGASTGRTASDFLAFSDGGLALSIPLYILVEVQVRAGQVGSLWDFAAAEANTST